MSKRKEDRQQQILRELAETPTLRIGDMARTHGVSTETIRRDLVVLDDERRHLGLGSGVVRRRAGRRARGRSREEPSRAVTKTTPSEGRGCGPRARGLSRFSKEPICAHGRTPA